MTNVGKSSLVLVLYTGGTIGMKKLSDNGKIIDYRDSSV